MLVQSLEETDFTYRGLLDLDGRSVCTTARILEALSVSIQGVENLIDAW